MKKIKLVTLGFCAAAFLCGCATQEQLDKLEQVEKQAEVNAVNYVKEKYGFDVDVEDVEAYTYDSSPFASYEATGEATVSVKCSDGSSFMVYINGETENTDGSDNYQVEEILQDINERALDILDLDADNLHMEIDYRKTIEGSLMVGTYYDGTNLLEVMEEASSNWYYSVIVSGMDLQSVDIQHIADELGTGAEVQLINCYDSEEFKAVRNRDFKFIDTTVMDYGIYVDDYMVYERDEAEYVDFENVDCGTFTAVMIDGTYCNATEISVDPTEWTGKGFLNPKQIFQAYAIDTDAKDVLFFVDVDKLDTDNYNQAALVTRYNAKDNTAYDGGNLTSYINGQYITNDISSSLYSDIVFTVLMDQ